MQTFKVFISEIDDIASVDALSARKAVFERLNCLDDSFFDDIETLEVIVHDEIGLKSIYRITPSRVLRCQKVG